MVKYSPFIFSLLLFQLAHKVIEQYGWDDFREKVELSIISGSVDETFQLVLDAPIKRWDEVIPLGNGLIGGLLWGEGGFIVTAEMVDSKTKRIELQATADDILSLECPWNAAQVVWQDTDKREILVPDNNGIISLNTNKDDILIFTDSDQ